MSNQWYSIRDSIAYKQSSTSHYTTDALC